MTGCLDETTVLAFLGGTLSPAGRATVEAHVAACSACAEILTWAAADSANASRGPGREGAPFIGQLAPGARVDRYQILGPVGRGGMGEVYAAYHPDLDRRIALKIVFESGADATERRARLLREARAIARLSHPNVVTVFDAGTVGDRVYIAMEFVDGETLDVWLATKKREWAEILDVFVAAGRGLAAAHAAKIIHRDFKPQNVMIARDGSVRVMDFGLAQLMMEDDGAGTGSENEVRATGSEGDFGSGPIDRRWPTVTRATKTGALLGTPAYMAPEQWRGEAIDARADQFSFCVALFEALYGARPTLRHIDSDVGAPVATSKPSGSLGERAVPRWLRDVLNRALSSDREKRFASMDELLSSLARARTRTRRRVSTLFAGLLVTVGLLTTWRLSHARSVDCTPPRDRIVGAWPVDDPGSTRRQSIRAALVASGTDGAESIWQRLSATLDSYVRQWGTMYRETCEATHVRHEQSPEVLDLRMRCLDDRLDQVRAIADGLASSLRPNASQALAATSEITSVAECADVRLLQSATPLPRDDGSARAVRTLETSLRSIEAQYDLGQYDDGLAKAIALRPTVEATGYQPLIGDLLEKIGRFQGRVTGPETAEGTLHQSLVAAISGGDNVTAAKAVSDLVYILGVSQRRPKEAREWAQLGYALLDHGGPAHSRIRGWLKQDEAQIWMREGNFERALEGFRQARTLKELELGPDHPDVGISINAAGMALLGLGRRTEGFEAFSQSLRIFDERGGAQDMNLSDRAEIFRIQGRLADAKSAFERALSTDMDELEMAYPLTGLGRTLVALGDPRRATPLLERALHTREVHQVEPPVKAETQFALACALWDAGGDKRRAMTLANAARATFRQFTIPPDLAGIDGEIDAWLAKHKSTRTPP